MTPFFRAYVSPDEARRVANAYAAAWHGGDPTIRAMLGDDEEAAMAQVGLIVNAEANREIWKNDTYQVAVRKCEALGGTLVHLSIKRLDKAPIHDWRDLQRIKSELVGPECEGVELYPAESRVVDTANQYHLWVLPKGQSWPFGFVGGRAISEDSIADSVQRPFEKGGGA